MRAISGGRLDVGSIIRKCIIDKNKGTHRMKNANSIKRAPVRLISFVVGREMEFPTSGNKERTKLSRIADNTNTAADKRELFKI